MCYISTCRSKPQHHLTHKHLLGPRLIIGFHINMLNMKACAQMSGHEVLFYDKPSVWVNETAICINVKPNESHCYAVLIKEDVWMRTGEEIKDEKASDIF